MIILHTYTHNKPYIFNPFIPITNAQCFDHQCVYDSIELFDSLNLTIVSYVSSFFESDSTFTLYIYNVI